ncbi:hypothetical protein SADUNF_Sadunf04G0006300 [Salix dunnii]|uniref:Uncharacterized protein n=1 Tax=Salix dunnii TaxID=1413687 RepID=A0A835KE60_9ROSI|nr:hypothetical protein SADUNF_Sadunf04G0006300 [Salix dunnii]
MVLTIEGGSAPMFCVTGKHKSGRVIHQVKKQYVSVLKKKGRISMRFSLPAFDCPESQTNVIANFQSL